VLYFRGRPATTPTTPGNEPAPLYVAVEDSAGHVAVVKHPDLDAATVTPWQEWRIAFSELAGVDLDSVAILYVGLGDRTSPAAGGAGLIYIDDIRIGHPMSPAAP
jgi:hypothetical protein